MDCRALVQGVLGDLEVAIRESGAEVTVGALPTVLVDPSQLRQVFQNLVSNALKFKGDQPLAVERKRAEQMFRGLLEAAPDAMVILNQAGQILLVNAQTEQLFGYTREGLISESIERLVPGHFRGQPQIHWVSYLADPRGQPAGRGLELYARRKDGSEFLVEISLSPLETEEGRLAITAIRDLTETRRWQELEILYALDRVMAQANRPEDVARLAAEQALPLLGFDAAAALLRIPGGRS